MVLAVVAAREVPLILLSSGCCGLTKKPRETVRLFSPTFVYVKEEMGASELLWYRLPLDDGVDMHRLLFMVDHGVLLIYLKAVNV